MKLYSERHGVRAPREKTYSISSDVYSLLLDCCRKYQKNLTHIFTLNCHYDFLNQDYVTFDERGFVTKIKVKIPALFRNENDRICAPTYDDQYDQYALLDLIEYIAQNIKDISEEWNNTTYRNYKEIACLNTSNVFEVFQEEVNEIFIEAGVLYELTDEKIIERIIENSPLTVEIENNCAAIQELGLKELLEDAIALYKTPNSAARQDSVEKIWDALERLKTYYITLNKKQSVGNIINDIAGGNSNFIKLFDAEFAELTKIGNEYRIRHHETNKIDIIDVRHYDYLFNRCLSLIALAIQYLG